MTLKISIFRPALCRLCVFFFLSSFGYALSVACGWCKCVSQPVVFLRQKRFIERLSFFFPQSLRSQLPIYGHYICAPHLFAVLCNCVSHQKHSRDLRALHLHTAPFLYHTTPTFHRKTSHHLASHSAYSGAAGRPSVPPRSPLYTIQYYLTDATLPSFEVLHLDDLGSSKTSIGPDGMGHSISPWRRLARASLTSLSFTLCDVFFACTAGAVEARVSEPCSRSGERAAFSTLVGVAPLSCVAREAILLVVEI